MEQPVASELGGLLRHWRGLRGKSQLELSLDTGVSQRHLSFIESGRSVPSRRTLMEIAEGLEVPLRERNGLLLAAGYAPVYAETPLEAPEMHGITRALDRMLRQHEPFPAMVMDRYWNVQRTNQAAPRFFGCFIDMAARPAPRNLLHLLFDPAGMRPFIANWAVLANALFERVRREATGRVIDDKTKELLAALLGYPDVKSNWKMPAPTDATPTLPVIPISFMKDGEVLSYFSMVTTVGTPQTIAAQELRIECLFPADEATEVNHRALMQPSPA